MAGEHDFDFLMRHDWRIRCRELQERLVGCQEWDEFGAELREVRPILGGYGNVDRFYAERRGRRFEATSLRIYDPAARLWRIHWADSFDYRLTPQVEGRFEGERGDFFGAEDFRGRRVELRFRWQLGEPERPYWEQAYRVASEQAWETNWTMAFEPL